MPMTTRREALGGLAAATALASPAAAAVRRRVPGKPKGPARAVLDQVGQEMLRLAPQSATSLGLDTGRNADLRAKLDGSAPGINPLWASEVDSIRARLGRLDRSRLTPMEAAQVGTLDYAAESAQIGRKFAFNNDGSKGLLGGPAPYVVSQQDGAITQVPEFLNSQHPVKTRADAEAYLARVAALGRVLDDEAARITADAAAGVAPPSFIARNALGQLQDYRKVPAAEQPMVQSLVKRAAAAGVTGDWQRRATAAVEQIVYPALDREIAAFARATRGSSDQAGTQRLPDGDAYYAWALRCGTTTSTGAEEIHQTGLRQNEEIKARIDAILKSQGMTQGTVGERVVALNSRPDQLFPNDDAGRAQLIAYIKGKIAATRALTPRVSHLGLKCPVDVKRVPPDIQDGAALGYMNPAALDGSRPAIYYVNLKSTSLWPKYQLATLSAHEAIPGHSWQLGYLAENGGNTPITSSMIGNNAFVEGWALYSEQLMDEMGLYANDPLGRVGYLQAQQFRACRLVADTGLHAYGWSRDKAVDFLVQQTGKGRDAMTSEIDRYCASPGQACGYKMGHNAIVALRDKARAQMGSRFDLASFDDTLIKTGGVPLALLDGVVNAWMRGQRT
jgi:uncharacterized protein (DUF885 family)